jgi:hypothetical protein
MLGWQVSPESMETFDRNRWKPSTGIDGNLRPESVETFDRNMHLAADERGHWSRTLF